MFAKKSIALLLFCLFRVDAFVFPDPISATFKQLIDEVYSEISLTDPQNGFISKPELPADPVHPVSSYDLETELPHQAPGTPHPQVKINSGLVIGETVNESHAFYSIPFAKPPVGPLR